MGSEMCIRDRDHATEENQTDADNQINLSLPGDQEGLEEQEESDVLVTSLAYTSVNDDTAELSEDDCDVADDDHGTGTFSYPELRSSWPAPRIESSGRDQLKGLF